MHDGGNRAVRKILHVDESHCLGVWDWFGLVWLGICGLQNQSFQSLEISTV